MAQFESYERRIKQIEKCMAEYGIPSLDEAREYCLKKGVDAEKIAKAARGEAPFFLHNADILSDLPLAEMYRIHLADSPLATLAVMERETSRHLLFDERGLLGRVDEGKGIRIEVRDAVGEVRKLAFGGVHVISPAFFRLTTERGAFSILDPYLRLSAAGERIRPHDVTGASWLEIGTPERLEAARRAVRG